MIRDARLSDAGAIAGIYNHYVLNTSITFEEEAVPGEVMQGRIQSVIPRLPWTVYQEGAEVVGYSYAAAWHARGAYRHSVECTIYLHADAAGRGIGKVLYSDLLERLIRLGLHRAVGVIALPNPASVALHEKLGFQKAAHLSEMGWKFERWIDVGYWLRELSV
jgi:L-amino acid N-acyltransferase YncA